MRVDGAGLITSAAGYTFAGTAYLNNAAFSACLDSDNDDIPDHTDVDDDNDGIRDTLEMNCVTNVAINSGMIPLNTDQSGGVSLPGMGEHDGRDFDFLFRLEGGCYLEFRGSCSKQWNISWRWRLHQRTT